MWAKELVDELCAYTGFTEAHAQSLRSIAPHVQPSFPRIVDRFYEAIFKDPRAAAVFTGGKAQVERQKLLLHGWLEGLVGGEYDAEYVRLRARIGRTHVRIRLDQRYMFAAMNIVRTGLHEALATAPLETAALHRAHDALDKICDIELAIMLETYAEDHLLRMRDRERLATLGQLSGFIGHELRNPLAVMETSLHLLKRRLPIDDERAQHHFQRLREQVSVSTHIISDLLELARDRPLVRESVSDLKALLEEVVREVHEHEGVTATIDISPDLPSPRLDTKQARRALLNLVTNACQAVHGQASPEVVVRASREADRLLLTVEDNGPGIAEELRLRLFEPLATTKAKGLGLGLALCRRIAEKHGGDIRGLKSPLGGARFELRLAEAYEE